jgi:hypothetical protein
MEVSTPTETQLWRNAASAAQNGHPSQSLGATVHAMSADLDVDLG